MIRPLALSLAIAVATTGWGQSRYTSAPTFSGPNPAVVRVVVPERNGASYGSGALVAVNESSGLVVTNWHVVRDAAGPITVLFPDGFRSGAYLLRTDRDWDLAALAVRRPNVAPIAISNVAPRPGEELMIAGYGSGSYRAVTGRCTQYVSPGGNQPFEMIELSAPARNGDSGGPILNNRGELAGVLFGSSFGRTAGSYCGRLRLFLGTIEGDFQRVSAQAMLAQQSRAAPPTVASIPSAMPTTAAVPGGMTARTDFCVSSGPCVVDHGKGDSPIFADHGFAAVPAKIGTVPGMRAVEDIRQPSAAPLAPVSTLPAVDWRQSSAAPAAAIPAAPAGPLPNSDQIKTVLAAIGVLAVLYHAMRLLGSAVG